MRQFWLWGVLLFSVICLAGCGRQKEVSEEMQGWKAIGFHAPEKTEGTSEVWAVKYDAWNMDGIEFENSGEYAYTRTAPKTWKHKSYSLYSIYGSQASGPLRWAMVIYDADTMQFETKTITYEQLGLVQEDGQRKRGNLIDVNWVDAEHYVFQWVEVSEREKMYAQTTDERIFTDLNGNVTTVDIMDFCKMRQYDDLEGKEASFVPAASCICDDGGHLYGFATKEGKQVLWVTDTKGELVMECPIPSGLVCLDSLRTDEGDIIFLFHGEGTKQILAWADVEGAKLRTVSELTGQERITRLLGMQTNVIYYENREEGKAYAWNVETGKRSLFINYASGNFSSAFRVFLIFQKDRAPMVRLWRGTDPDTLKTEDWLVTVGEEPKDDQVRMSMLVTDDVGNKLISEAAEQSFRMDPNNSFVSNSIKTKEEKERLLNELIAGNGPDIIYVSRGDFLVMAQKGLFMDISELIGEDMLDRFLPGARDLGKVDERLYGLPVSITACSYLIADETWSGNSWDIHDMLGLIREGKLDGSITYINSGTQFAPLAAVMMLLRLSYHESWLIDWETKKCHFNEDVFVDLLNALKEGGEPKEAEGWLDQGRRVAYIDISSGDFISEFGVREEFEHGHYVGFPTGDSCGNYLDTRGILAINAKTTKKNEIRELLSCLFDANIQKRNWVYASQTALPIIKLTQMDMTVKEGKTFFEGTEIIELSDGRTTMDAAEEFLESCVAAPMQEAEIENILREELGGFFQGAKDARETAEVIQSRVQLLINE